MPGLDDLLTVQEHDSSIDRLRARRERLPERAELIQRQGEASEVEAALAELRGQRDAVAREERQLDDNVNAIQVRINEVEGDLYAGRITAPRELQALQADIEQLKRQRSSLEDQELDAMERREGLDRQVAGLEERLGTLSAEVERLGAAIVENEQEIDQELALEGGAREAAAGKVTQALLEQYEAIRVRNDGIGAARLVGGTCQGCHLALSAVEVDRIKRLPTDEVVRCDQCGAILVRP
ncbi:MAG: hypothetical protein HYU28_04995 [Actinobacteria bacterium]|nr:hypothetical protein [Actinomycetota bacterium]